MKIQFNEIIMATKDIEKTKDFYQRLFLDKANTQHHDFFYTLTDDRSVGQVSVVPHNGESKWDNAWLSISTDNLPKAIDHIKELGVDAGTIEKFGPEMKNGKHIGVTFRDPDGRLIMLLSEENK